MKTVKFIIPGRLAGANELTHAIHRFVGGKIKKSETRRCALAAIVGGVPKITKPVNMHYHWFEPNKKRDKSNVRYAAKFIEDGLQECGKLPNDTWAWVNEMSDKFSIDKERPRIEVEIEECE